MSRRIRHDLHMHLNPNAYALIGLTAMVAALIGILVFAVLKFASAARESRLHLRENKSEIGICHRGTARGADQGEGAGARDVGARRGVRTAQQRDRREPVVGPSRRRERWAAPHPESGGTPAARAATSSRSPSRIATCCLAALAQLIEECLRNGEPIVRRTLQISSADQSPGISRRQRVAAVERTRGAARRHLPVHRSDARRRDGGAATAEGKPCAGGRADRGHRARVPQRPCDDPRLRAAARPERAAARRIIRTCTESARRRKPWAKS